MNHKIIEKAIRAKSVIEFDYGTHHRLVKPHVFCISGGSIQILSYKIAGSSSYGGIPEWRRFELDRISNLSATDRDFHGRRPFPSRRHSSWDRDIDS